MQRAPVARAEALMGADGDGDACYGEAMQDMRA